MDLLKLDRADNIVGSAYDASLKIVNNIIFFQRSAENIDKILMKDFKPNKKLFLEAMYVLPNN
jgi:hypothetical protein